MLKALPCCLALLVIAIGEPADVQPRASDIQSIEQQHFRPQTLLTALETWVSSQFDLPAIHEHPSIEFASPAKIVSLRFAGLLSDPGEQVARTIEPRLLNTTRSRSTTTPRELSICLRAGPATHRPSYPCSSLSKCAEAQTRVPTRAREACLYRSGPLARSIWT